MNLVLALVWCLLTGSATPWNFIAGLLVGAAVVSVYGSVSDQRHYVRSILSVLRFGVYFFAILTKANIQIAREVVTPGLTFRPRIIRYNVSHLGEVERTTLSNAITLTPGTLVVDISPDGNWFYIHCLYGQNRDRAIADINELARRLHEGVFS